MEDSSRNWTSQLVGQFPTKSSATNLLNPSHEDASTIDTSHNYCKTEEYTERKWTLEKKMYLFETNGDYLMENTVS